MKKIPKVVLIGAGRFGLNYLRVLKTIQKEKKIEFLGVVVKNPVKYQNIALEHNIKIFKELPKNILEKIDAVIIVTPPETHFKIAKNYLKYCSVFIEKPVATNQEDSLILEKIAKKYKRTFIVGHIFRFSQVTKKLKTILGENLPQKINGFFINPENSDQGREPTVELLHLFDILDYIWPVIPTSIFSMSEGRTSIVDLRYSNNYDARLSMGWKGEEKIRTLKFRYPKKMVEADFLNNKIEIKDRNGLLIKKFEFSDKKELLYLELIDFIDKLKTKKPESNIKMALRVLSISIKSIPKKIKIPKVAIIGGGIFGLSVANELGSFCDVTLFEKNKELMQEGTMINQFRHHYGYHYPRSDETVIDVQRSRSDFEEIFNDALFVNSPTYYALAKEGSRVNVEEFIRFCNKHKLPYTEEYPSDDLLSRKEIDLSIRVPEPSYHHEKLKQIAESRIGLLPNVKMHLDTSVDSCTLLKDGEKNIIYTHKGKKKEKKFDYVINATYANINRFVNWLNFEQCPIRVDLAEVLIVKIPVEPVSITVIDGLFATLMPTGNLNEFTLYHVKESIIDRYVPSDGLVKMVKKHKTNEKLILSESLKFFPILKKASVIESRIVHRGVQAYHEHDDARVADLIGHGFGCWSILSGKILSSVTTAKRLSKIIKKTI